MVSFIIPSNTYMIPTLLRIGMNKMVINHLDKLFVTSDAATIIREVEVNHPAARMIAMAAKMQESEAGDGTNFVISFAGELMQQAE
jgi:T-complex protein 1 subunit theta